MNNQRTEAMHRISKDFPVSYNYTELSYSNLHPSPSVIKRRVCKRIRQEKSDTAKECKIEMEMDQLVSEKYEALDIIKFGSNIEGSLTKFRFFIDSPTLEMKPTGTECESRNLLCNNQFIGSYMRLSQREKEVLKQLSLMKTSEEIGSKLNISVNTIKNHRKRIRQKVDLRSREDQSRFLYWVRGFVS